MTSTSKILEGTSGCPIYVREWRPDVPALGGLIILHGMAEHSGRYDAFAAFMAGQGLCVRAYDHRQHGLSICHDTYGILGDSDTLDAILEDTDRVRDDFVTQLKDLPLVMMGHSMGSVLLRCYLQAYQPEVAAVVLSGSPVIPAGQLKAGRLLATYMGRREPMERSPFLNQMSVGGYNRSIPGANTDFDWLSIDQANVEAYINDPMCGYAYNPVFYSMFAGAVLSANRPEAMKAFPKVPTLLISGDQDPCSGSGKGFRKLASAYKAQGLHMTLRLMDKMRHEVLNEYHRKDTYKAISDFLLQVLA